MDVFPCTSLQLRAYCPYITEELWQRLEPSEKYHSIHTAAWPNFDPEAISAQTLIVPIQVNGRVRGRIEVEWETTEDEMKRQALHARQVQPFLVGQQVTRVIYVPGRLVNIVTV